VEYLRYLIDYGIIGILLFLSIISVAIAIERIRYYKKVDVINFSNSKELETDLTKGLYIIATIGANAPYIGLLGTVDSKKIMVGLALALKATAVGLLVAIPSVTLYNYLLRKVKEKIALWEVKSGRKGI